MKPTLSALLTLFQRHPGEWLNHAVCYESGGHRTTARIMELRRAGHRISQEGQGERSKYRYDGPPDPGYERFSCGCGWAGVEHEAHRTHDWFQCPRCQRALPTGQKPPLGYQMALLP